MVLMPWWFWLLLGVGAAAATTVIFWDSIRETVVDWLDRNGFEDSWVKEVIVFIDKIVVGIRERIFVRTKDNREIKISDKPIDESKIDDPEVLEALRKRGRFKAVMEYTE